MEYYNYLKSLHPCNYMVCIYSIVRLCQTKLHKTITKKKFYKRSINNDLSPVDYYTIFVYWQVFLRFGCFLLT
jgi:hypothetical protein